MLGGNMFVVKDDITKLSLKIKKKINITNNQEVVEYDINKKDDIALVCDVFIGENCIAQDQLVLASELENFVK